MKCSRCQGISHIRDYRPDGTIDTIRPCYHSRYHFSELDPLKNVRGMMLAAGTGALLSPSLCDNTWLERCQQTHPADMLIQKHYQEYPDTPTPFALQFASTTTSSDSASVVLNSNFLKAM